jgi:hypothetical protein
MDPSPETLEHLRYEALAALCRDALNEQLASTEQQLGDLQKTRSPFSMFSGREAKAAFSRSVQDLEQSAQAMRDLLGQVQLIEQKLTPILRTALDAYLELVSADYQQMKQALQSIAGWQARLTGLAELLVAFARDFREVRTAPPGQPMLRAIATVRGVAVRLEAEHLLLAGFAQQAEGILAAAGSPLRLPEVPELRRAACVQRLAVLSHDQAKAEGARVESETRQFIAEGMGAASARAQQCQEACQACADQYLEGYWNQLRTFSREQWQEDLAVEEAIQKLTVRYIHADIVRHQSQIADDPFRVDR